MKSLKMLFIMLLMGSLSVMTACKKSSDANPDHKVVFKATTNPKTTMNSATYTDGAGKTQNFTNGDRLSAWSSAEILVPVSAKTVSFSAEANALASDPSFYLTVEIWVDGAKKAETTTTTVNNKGMLKASVAYTF